ncbi:MAG: DUF5615 family PIN-like protein [Acidobacteriaceae bacterium]|nr:DUF5615 family PIN-like protein [Acidobacteriaceae bacterium]MBV9779110.1 DUF5615 family PIN-like protein [Acidobacteriaceae bacterium]
MKILLDECLPKDLGNSFAGHQCQTVPEAGFAGKSNGELLVLAEQAGFAVFVSVDKGLIYQQNLRDRAIALIVIRARSNKLEDLVVHMPACLAVLRSIRPGQVVRVS